MIQHFFNSVLLELMEWMGDSHIDISLSRHSLKDSVVRDVSLAYTWDRQSTNLEELGVSIIVHQQPPTNEDRALG